MKIFFSAGEPSGDLHGANLIRELRRRVGDIECVGYGGPEMAAAGCSLDADLTRLAVMWFLRALLNLHHFWELASRADRYFAHQRPDAVVLIDYPGFNWWIARRAKAHGIPVFYYAPPQLWAWASWRVAKMRRLVDHVLCSLPFEESWFRERGCRATFVGHPYFDEVRRQRLDEQFMARLRCRPGRLVTILPGSRTQEVTHNLEWLLRAAQKVRARHADVRFAVASFKPRHAQLAREIIQRLGFSPEELPVEVYVRRTPELIEAAECCLAVSGSVSLELLYRRKPSVILYFVSRGAYYAQRKFRRVKYITLVNLLADDDLFPHPITPYDPQAPEHQKALFPEYVACDDRSTELAAPIIAWLGDEACRQQRIAQLARLTEVVGHGGAARRAADLILAELARRRQPVARPHFLPQAMAGDNRLAAAGILPAA